MTLDVSIGNNKHILQSRSNQLRVLDRNPMITTITNNSILWPCAILVSCFTKDNPFEGIVCLKDYAVQVCFKDKEGETGSLALPANTWRAD